MKRRLTLVAVAALAPALAILAYNEFAVRRSVAAQVGVKALEYNRHASSEIGRVFEGVRALLVATGSMAPIRNAAADPAGCQEALASVVSAAPWIRTILVLNTSGMLVCDTLGSKPASFADRGYFQEAMKGIEFYVGEYTDSRLSGSPILPVSVPLRDRSGAIIGVVSTAIRLDWFNQRLRERGMAEGNALTIADRNGTIVARDPDPERFVGSKIPEPFMRLVNGSVEGTLEVVSQDGNARVLGYSPSSKSPFGLYVSVGLSRDKAFAELNRQTLVGALSIVLGVLVAMGAAWFAGGLIRRPVNRIAKVIEDWKSGVLDSRTGLRSDAGDVESVGAALDQLLDELEHRQRATLKAEEQRDLLMRELAHRVKNTLALVQAIASQTFGRDKPEAGQVFTERLAALAGAYDVLLGEQFRGGDIKTVLAAALKPHLTAADRVSMTGPPVTLSAQRALSLSLVVHELATNAVKYGALSNETGSVHLAWELAEGLVLLKWREQGGPPVIEPTRTGFGTKLIRRAFGNSAREIELEYAPSGVACTIAFEPSDG